MNVSALIPAFNPTAELIDLVGRLVASEFHRIVVVDDGSKPETAEIFREISRFDKVVLLRHGVNLGKGAALKMGLNHAYCAFNDDIGVVTLDADGQHLVEDALDVARTLEQQPHHLVMGVRTFQEEVPLRSRFGNSLTKCLFRLLVGQNLTDTQTGLRGIPRDFIPTLLRIPSSGYEYELDMLLACKYSGRTIIEREIHTVYLDGNKSSHFHPLVDSMKIYFVLFRFALASSATAAIDYTVFLLVYLYSANVLVSQVAARIVAMFFNYTAVKKLVFYSEQRHTRTFPKYAALVLVSGSLSYLLIDLITRYSGTSVIPAKVISELLIFLANFAIQRDFIFTRQEKQTFTDWDRYYKRPYKTASFTRKITEKALHTAIRRFCRLEEGKITLAELGGANSCFLEGIMGSMPISEYHVIDNNYCGIKKLHDRVTDKPVFSHQLNVLDLKTDLSVDLAFSVGLIEHFSEEDTKKAVVAHFGLLRPGAIAIISFPTPTFLYRVSRAVCEMSGLWIFHDERPLSRQEVAGAIEQYGTIVDEQVIWPIFLTQRMMVIRRNEVHLHQPALAEGGPVCQ